MPNPLVSIVIPAYNSAKYIRETLDSCLAQTYPNTELIVIDDGSTDETVSIVQAYGDKIRLIQQTKSGPAIARNTGIQAAEGAYIQFCDSDDVLYPQKIEQSMRVLQQDTHAALAYCQMQAVDENGEIIAEQAPVPLPTFFESNELFCKILAANGSAIQTSTILARKSALQAVGNYRADPQHICAEDWDLLLRLANQYRFVGIPHVMVKYRIRDGALTTKPIIMAQGRLKTIQYARHYARRHECINDRAYDQLEAGRHHSLAMTLWQHNQNDAARQHLIEAMRLTAQGRVLRGFAFAASYLMPFHRFDKLFK